IQYDLLAVKLVLAASDRHPGRTGVRPNGAEKPGLDVKASDPQARRFCPPGLENKLRLEEPALVHHRLMAVALLANRVSGPGMKRLEDIPIADEFFQELLTDPRLGARFISGLRVFLGLGNLVRPNQQAERQGENEQAESPRIHEWPSFALWPRLR